MPFSYNIFNDRIVKYLQEDPTLNTKRVLDVGPGAGKYSTLLRESVAGIDGVEIFEPYIKRFKLKTKYDNVFVANILEFEFDHYDIIIMGDIMEHLTVPDATSIISSLTARSGELIIVVPYESPQGECHGNAHEKHEQPDLTYDVMQERYPTLNVLWSNRNLGAYTTKPSPQG